MQLTVIIYHDVNDRFLLTFQPLYVFLIVMSTKITYIDDTL
jgi:hypothetical protein